MNNQKFLLGNRKQLVVFNFTCDVDYFYNGDEFGRPFCALFYGKSNCGPNEYGMIYRYEDDFGPSWSSKPISIHYEKQLTLSITQCDVVWLNISNLSQIRKISGCYRFDYPESNIPIDPTTTIDNSAAYFKILDDFAIDAYITNYP